MLPVLFQIKNFFNLFCAYRISQFQFVQISLSSNSLFSFFMQVMFQHSILFEHFSTNFQYIFNILTFPLLHFCKTFSNFFWYIINQLFLTFLSQFPLFFLIQRSNFLIFNWNTFFNYIDSTKLNRIFNFMNSKSRAQVTPPTAGTNQFTTASITVATNNQTSTAALVPLVGASTSYCYFTSTPILNIQQPQCSKHPSYLPPYPNFHRASVRMIDMYAFAGQLRLSSARRHGDTPANGTSAIDSENISFSDHGTVQPSDPPYWRSPPPIRRLVAKALQQQLLPYGILPIAWPAIVRWKLSPFFETCPAAISHPPASVLLTLRHTPHTSPSHHRVWRGYLARHVPLSSRYLLNILHKTPPVIYCAPWQ